MRVPLFLISFFLILYSCNSEKKPESDQETLILDKNWQFRQQGENFRMPGNVPGNVHTDLIANNRIPDPYIEFNEKKVQWIENEDWEYSLKFEVPHHILSKNFVQLVFEGLDTYADIYLNGTLIQQTDNMFVSWKIACKEYLIRGENELKVYFHSPVKRGLEKLKQLDYILPVVNEQESNFKRTSAFTRKAAFHYGWDWSPRLVTSGIWRPVKLQAWNKACIDNIQYRLVKLTDSIAIYKVISNITAYKDERIDWILKIYPDGDSIFKSVKLYTGKNSIEQIFRIKDPKIWWTNGLGEHPLYKINLQLISGTKLLDENNTRIGIRKLEIETIKDSIGTTFQVKLNDIPVFMKGTNYVPPDILRNTSEEDYRRLINDAVVSNMNMIRIMGGGIYEDDTFYDVCDENGILIWQDFMFTTAMQPGDSGHMANIKNEAVQNVIRLRNHPSIALWCGNNENLTGWLNWGWKSRFTNEVADKIWKDYETIFREILPQAVNDYDSGRFYHPSSPFADWNEIPNNQSGDQHDWSVWFGNALIENYRNNSARFVSEYGVQSLPAISTLLKVVNENELNLNSNALNFRQKSDITWMGNNITGNSLLEHYISDYYNYPDNPEDIVYVSQLMQAEALKTAIETHRSKMPVCMGSLYWQFNDCWPGITWSTRDYYGNWKAGLYQVKSSFKPVKVLCFTNNRKAAVYLISDSLRSFNATVSIEVSDFSGNLTQSINIPVQVKPNASELIYSFDEKEIVSPDEVKNKMIIAKLFMNEKLRDMNLGYFDYPKNLALTEPSIILKTEEVTDGYLITLSSDVLAKNVYLQISGIQGRLEDNFMDILPGSPKKIMFYTRERTGNIYSQISYKSLFNTY